MEIISRYWFCILFVFIVLVIRLIFRYMTRNYEETEGYIVDFNTQRFHGRYGGYYHKPIVQFYVDGECYRSVKSTLFLSHHKNPNDSLVFGYLGDSVRVKYNPTTPKNNYCLYSLKDLKYDFIVIIPALIIIAILLLILT